MCVSETLSGLNQNLGKAAQETEPYDPALYRAGSISGNGNLRDGRYGNALSVYPSSQDRRELAWGIRDG